MSEWSDLTQEQEDELTEEQANVRLKGLIKEFRVLWQARDESFARHKAATEELEDLKEKARKAEIRVDRALRVVKYAAEVACVNEEREEPKDDRIQW